MNDRPLPVYGKGENIRDWLFVDDHAAALIKIVKQGRPGETYLVGGGAERRNIDVVTGICAILDAAAPRADGQRHDALITYVEDRPGHDYRYAIDDARTRTELDWQPRMDFEEGLAATVEWYRGHQGWWEPLLSERYDGGRLGLGRSEGG